MKPARRVPTAVHLMSVAILASGFIPNMVKFAALDSLISFEGIDEIAATEISVADADVDEDVPGQA